MYSLSFILMDMLEILHPGKEYGPKVQVMCV